MARRIVASFPRGRSRVARFISHHYPTAQTFSLLGPLARNYMYLDTSDPLQADIAYGAYQSSVIDTVLRLARPGDFIVTAGAHLGYVALAAAQAVGPDGKVLAFEADPRMVEWCLHNLALNRCQTVQLLPVGLGSSNGELEMSLSSNPGQSSFAIRNYHLEYARIAVRPGDEILSEMGVEQVDGIVLDVEGWEMHVLEGLSKTLSNHVPRWAVVECWDVALKAAGSSAVELLGELKRIGWNIANVDGGAARDGHDIICIRPHVEEEKKFSLHS